MKDTLALSVSRLWNTLKIAKSHSYRKKSRRLYQNCQNHTQCCNQYLKIAKIVTTFREIILDIFNNYHVHIHFYTFFRIQKKIHTHQINRFRDFIFKLFVKKNEIFLSVEIVVKSQFTTLRLLFYLLYLNRMFLRIFPETFHVIEKFVKSQLVFYLTISTKYFHEFFRAETTNGLISCFIIRKSDAKTKQRTSHHSFMFCSENDETLLKIEVQKREGTPA